MLFHKQLDFFIIFLYLNLYKQFKFNNNNYGIIFVKSYSPPIPTSTIATSIFSCVKM